MVRLKNFIFAGVMCLRRTNYIVFIFAGVMCHVSTPTPSLHHSKHVTSLQTFLSFSDSQFLSFYKPFQRTAPPKALQLSTKKRAKLQKILIQMLIFFKKSTCRGYCLNLSCRTCIFSIICLKVGLLEP